MSSSAFNGKNYAIWQNNALNPQEFGSLKLKARLEYLCLLAHLAPSTHNTQPWRFFADMTEPSVTIYIDRHFVLPASDADGRQAAISLGCALENMVCGARYFGLNPTVEFLTNDAGKIGPFSENEPGLTAVIKIKFAKSEPDLMLEKIIKAIFKRKVMRAEYDPQKNISAEILQSLQKFTDNDTTKLHLVTDSIRRLGIAEFQSQADAFVINSAKFSRELGDWLLPNDTASFVGMPGIGFGLPDDQALRLHHGLSGKTSLQPEDGLKFAAAGKIGLEKCPLIGVITTKKDDVENWLSAGRIFERIFLELTSQGANLAMHAGITEVTLVKKIFSVALGTTRHVTVLFRAGYVKKEKDAARPHSPRLPLEKALLNDKP